MTGRQRNKVVGRYTHAQIVLRQRRSVAANDCRAKFSRDLFWDGVRLSAERFRQYRRRREREQCRWVLRCRQHILFRRRYPQSGREVQHGCSHSDTSGRSPGLRLPSLPGHAGAGNAGHGRHVPGIRSPAQPTSRRLVLPRTVLRRRTVYGLRTIRHDRSVDGPYYDHVLVFTQPRQSLWP